MKKILTVKLLGIVLFLFIFHSCSDNKKLYDKKGIQIGLYDTNQSAIMNTSINATLEVFTENKNIRAKIRFWNEAEKPAYLWSINAPEDGEMTRTLFKIFCDGKEIKYDGIMVKRGTPELDEFIELKSGESYEIEIPISRYYNLPDKFDECTLQYSVLNPNRDGEGFFNIDSNVVKLTL